jgi:ABC-type lipoprotein release transport system permease subunit
MALPLSYNWRNLFARRTTTLLTVLVVAAVVSIFAWLLGFRSALAHSLAFASDPRKMIVLKQASTSETNSAIAPDEAGRLTQLDREVARDPQTGQPLRSPEMITQVWLPRLRDGGATHANVAVRGVTEDAFRVHRNVKLLGECFRPGQMEIIVGRAAARQFGGLEIGKTVNLGYSSNRGYRVVGHFSADGGPMESEIWGPLTLLMDSYSRRMYSSVNLRLNDAVDPAEVIRRIEGPSIELTAQTEPQYWHEQAKHIRIYLSIVSLLVGIMCIAAAFSMANTMFSAVAARTREFAMLRTIGFTGRQILASLLVEAVLLSLIGGAVGCAACAGWLAAAGNTKDMFGATTFTTMAFEIRLTPSIVALSLAAVAVVGAVGALTPGFRAARIRVVEAMREA